jgi:hypothetical protein
MAAGAAGAAAAGAAAVITALKASGVIVRVEPEEFLTLLERTNAPLVVRAKAGVFRKYHQYLTSYKGLAFVARSDRPLRLPAGAEVVQAGKIWIPD